MALYRGSAGIIDDEPDQAAIFAPFAGTEGYHPVAYIPYIAAAAIGRLLGLDFPDLLLLMRLFGLAAFTAAAAYAVAVTPVLKWAFVLIAMLPVSLYNRSVLSADGAALCSAMVITALCLKRRVESCRWAGLGALTVDDALRSQQAASDRIRAAGVDGLPPQGAAAALEQHCDRGLAMPYSVPPMGGRSVGRCSGLAPSNGRPPSA